jgi:small GTP-binding protein
VGKTAYINRLCYNEFDLQSAPTIGIEFGLKNYKKDNRNYEIEIWDTAGQEKFNSITRGMYKNVIGNFLEGA